MDALKGAGYTTCVVLGHSKGGLNAFMFGAQVASPPPLVVSLAGRFKPRDGVLQRFGPNILDQLVASPAMPRKEANGMEWVLTLEVGCREEGVGSEGGVDAICPWNDAAPRNAQCHTPEPNLWRIREARARPLRLKPCPLHAHGRSSGLMPS